MRHPEQEHVSTVPPSHPGRSLRDRVLPGLGLSVSQAARELGVARSTLHRVLAGEAAVTPEMAARLARLSGVPARHWLARQQEHDLWHTERALADVLRRIPAHRLPGTLGEEIRGAARD
jgi:addiction module HigA family antidote